MAQDRWDLVAGIRSGGENGEDWLNGGLSDLYPLNLSLQLWRGPGGLTMHEKAVNRAISSLEG